MAGIKDSGRLTKKTMEKMHSPRCGNIDVENPAKLSKMKKRFGTKINIQYFVNSEMFLDCTVFC